MSSTVSSIISHRRSGKPLHDLSKTFSKVLSNSRKSIFHFSWFHETFIYLDCELKRLLELNFCLPRVEEAVARVALKIWHLVTLTVILVYWF